MNGFVGKREKQEGLSLEGAGWGGGQLCQWQDPQEPLRSAGGQQGKQGCTVISTVPVITSSSRELLFSDAYYVPDIVLNSAPLSSLNVAVLSGRHYYQPHFSDEETEGWDGQVTSLTKVPLKKW